MTLSISHQLADLLGDDAVLLPERLDDYALDGLTPQAVVHPADREGISSVLRWASENHVAVCPRGGGTQLALGNVPSRVDLVLDLSQCNRILAHQPADLTATVEAGITLEALQQELARQGQFLPLEAPLLERATIGGILAANASGPLRLTYGLAREWLIGIGVVSANGVETKAGGKVVKNVTGYDLNKLYTGSLGTLGVIVEATFKLSPLPQGSGTLVMAFRSIPQGIEAARALLRQAFAPQALQVIDGLVARRLDVAPTPPEGGAAVIAFFSGRARAVQRKLGEAVQLFRDGGAVQVERYDEAGQHSPVASPPAPSPSEMERGFGGEAGGGSLLQRLINLGWTKGTEPHLGLKINGPPSAVGQIVGAIRESPLPRISALGHPPGIIADVGFGVARLLWWGEEVTGGNNETVTLAAISQLRSLVRESGGSVVVEQCPLSVKRQIDVWGDEHQGIEIMRRIKQQFDPLGILNPGRFVGGI